MHTLIIPPLQNELSATEVLNNLSTISLFSGLKINK